jgi:lipopolysaccharide transport system ATP-binding protein
MLSGVQRTGTKPAIRVEGLSKQYRIGAQTRGASLNLTESIAAGVSGVWRGLTGRGRGRDGADEFWALKDVSFEVRPGEVVGIIGRNGAGKSTLLKILSRITEPTSGRAVVRGQMASLLEVGTGFHPELTGRENVYLNGSILGMSRREIGRKFDEIVDFAEIPSFIDTPVKRYSSGMSVRLAFAVAAHLEARILVLDEVLAVGDSQFQEKCLGKVGEVARDGRTVLFVSHNMQAVAALCTRAILLRQGRVSLQGNPREVVRSYLEGRVDQSASFFWQNGAAPGDDIARLRSVRVLDEHGHVKFDHDIARPISVEVELAVLKPGSAVHASIHLTNESGVCLFAVDGHLHPNGPKHPVGPGLYRCTCRIPASFLNDGKHFVSAFAVRNSARITAQAHEVVAFVAHDYGASRGGYMGKVIGAIRPALPWDIEHLGDVQ